MVTQDKTRVSHLSFFFLKSSLNLSPPYNKLLQDLILLIFVSNISIFHFTFILLKSRKQLQITVGLSAYVSLK